MNKKIYIISETYRASLYGIGTYLNELVTGLRKADFEFGLIKLRSDEKTVKMKTDGKSEEISIPFSAGHNYYRNSAYVLRSLLPKEEDDMEYVFHINAMSNPTFVSYLKKLFRCKVVLVVHYTNWSFGVLGNLGQLDKTLHKPHAKRDHSERQIVRGLDNDLRQMNNCDKVVCVANHTLEAFKKLYRDSFNLSKATVINNAQSDVYKELGESEKLALRKKYHIDDGYQVVVFAGRLDDVKGVHCLIEAFRIVLEKMPKTRLIMAGGGAFEKQINNAAGIWSKVTFTARLNKQQLYDMYQLADVGVMPSLYEEFGLVAIEMMMHKIPLIVSDTGGLADIVDDGLNGLKVPVVLNDKANRMYVDPQLLADKIKLLLGSPEKRSQLGSNARLKYLSKYEIGNFTRKMVEVYESI